MAMSAGDVIWFIRGDLSGLNKALAEGRKNVQSSMTGMSASAKQVAGAFSVAGAGILAGLGLAVGGAVKFKSAIAEVSTLGVRDMKTLEKGVMDIATRYGKDLTESARGAYQVVSATGLNAAKSVEVLNLATKASVAGVAEVSEAVLLGTGVMNAYGKETSDLSGIFDEAFVAVKAGVTTFGELASSVGKVSPAMASVGLSSKEMFAAIAALTKGGLSTAEAVTGLKAALTNVIKPSREAKDLAEKLGINFSAAGLKSKGLKKFLEELNGAVGGNVTEMGKFFGSTEALNAVLALAGKQSKSFSDILAEMHNSIGMTDEAFEKMVRNDPAQAFNKIRSKAQRLGVILGTALLPALKEVLDVLGPIVDKLSEWTMEHPKLTAVIGTSTGVFAGFAIAAWPVVFTLDKLLIIGPKLRLMWIAVATALSPITSIVIAVTAGFLAYAAAVYAGIRAVAEWMGAKDAAVEARRRENELYQKLGDLRFINEKDMIIKMNMERLRLLREGNEALLAEAARAGMARLEYEQYLIEQIKGTAARWGVEAPDIEKEIQAEVLKATQEGGDKRVDAEKKTIAEIRADKRKALTEVVAHHKRALDDLKKADGQWAKWRMKYHKDEIADAKKQLARLGNVQKERSSAQDEFRLKEARELRLMVDKTRAFLQKAIEEYVKLPKAIRKYMPQVTAVLRESNLGIKSALDKMVSHFRHSRVAIEDHLSQLVDHAASKLSTLADIISQMNQLAASGASAPAPVGAGEGGGGGGGTGGGGSEGGGSTGSTVNINVIGGGSNSRALGSAIARELRARGILL